MQYENRLFSLFNSSICDHSPTNIALSFETEVKEPIGTIHNMIVSRGWFLSLIVYRQDEDNIRKKIRDKERQIQQIKYRANDRLLKFGAWMPNLVNTIKTAVRDGRFTKPPRGPIGDMYLYTVHKIHISCCITGVIIVKTFVNSMLSLSFLN